jgi:hypothetical protein
LDREEVLQKSCLPEEISSLKERLGISEENCHYFLEEISLAEEDGGNFYWSLPVAEDLNYAYRQPVAVKIYHDTIHFLQNYDYNPAIHVRQFPNDFVLKRAMPFQEKAIENRLALPVGQHSWVFVSLVYIPSSMWGTSQLAQLCTIIHQVTGPSGGAFGMIWNFQGAIPEPPECSVPSFILPTPLDGRPTAGIRHIAIKLEEDVLKSVSDNSVFAFPPGEYILDIQLDGVTFPVFWHQKENSPPYRVFFFQSFDRKKYSFGRMTYFRSLNVSGGVITDPSSAMFSGAEGPVLGGWCLGTISDNFQQKVAKIISTIAAMQDISQPRVLCMGSSAGGFMALKMAEYFPEVNIAVFNPQIDCLKYNKKNVEHILRCTNFCDDIPPEFRRRMIADPMIVNNRRCIFFSQNVFDRQYEEHFLPFLQRIEQDSSMPEILSHKA